MSVHVGSRQDPQGGTSLDDLLMKGKARGSKTVEEKTKNAILSILNGHTNYPDEAKLDRYRSAHGDDFESAMNKWIVVEDPAPLVFNSGNANAPFSFGITNWQKLEPSARAIAAALYEVSDFDGRSNRDVPSDVKNFIAIGKAIDNARREARLNRRRAGIPAAPPSGAARGEAGAPPGVTELAKPTKSAPARGTRGNSRLVPNASLDEAARHAAADEAARAALADERQRAALSASEDESLAEYYSGEDGASDGESGVGGDTPLLRATDNDEKLRLLAEQICDALDPSRTWRKKSWNAAKITKTTLDLAKELLSVLRY